MFKHKLLNLFMLIYLLLALSHFQFFKPVEVEVTLVSCAQVSLNDGDRYYECDWEGENHHSSVPVSYQDYVTNLERLGSTSRVMTDDPRQHMFWIYLMSFLLGLALDWLIISKRGKENAVHVSLKREG